MKHPRIYDQLVSAGAKLLASASARFQSAFTKRKGEARMAALVGPYTSGRYGPRQWDKYEQVRQYQSWVYRCVQFIAQGTRTPPQIVKVTPDGDRDRYNVALKRWRQKGYTLDTMPERRKFLSEIQRKATVGPVESHEEYEYLPNTHPAVRLMNDPNEPQTGVKFWQAVGTFEELTGESFIWVVENGAGQPVELWVLPSQWVTPRNDGSSGRLVDFYEVRAVNGPIEIFAPEEIIWSKNDNPWHPLMATSPLQTQAATVDAYNMIQVARFAAMDNGTMAGGVITMPPDVQTDQTILSRLEMRFLAKNGGPQNAGRPLILEGGLQWTPPSAALEIAFMQGSDQLRRYVMAHYGLDEAMMGFSNSSTYAAAVITRRSLYERVFAPRLEDRAAMLTERLLPRFGTDLRAVYVQDTTTQDPDVKRNDWQLAVNAKAVTQNEIRTELLGLEPVDDPAADMLPRDPLDALGGGMGGWDADPGQTKPEETPRPGFTAFGGGPDDVVPKGMINRLAELNGKH